MSELKRRRRRTKDVLYLRDLPVSVKRRYQEVCKERKTNMTREVRKHMVRFIVRHEQSQRRKEKQLETQ